MATKNMTATKIKIKRARIQEIFSTLKQLAEMKMSAKLGYALGKNALRFKEEMELIAAEQARLFKSFDKDDSGSLKPESPESKKFNHEFTKFILEEVELTVYKIKEDEFDGQPIPIALYAELGPIIDETPSTEPAKE